MKITISATIWLVLAIIGFTGTSAIGNDDFIDNSIWKSLGGNFKRTGLSKNHGLEVGCIKCKLETKGPVLSSITVGFNNRLHIAGEDGKLYTFDPNSCGLLWIYDANTPLVSSPTVGPEGNVYVGCQNGELHAINIYGKLEWIHVTNGSIFSSPAVSASGNIYACSQDGILYALDRKANLLWSFETKGPGQVSTGTIFSSPAIGIDETVYISGLYDPNLYALDPNDGSLKWVCNFESGGWPFASPVVAENGTIYQTLLYDTNLYAIDHNDGTIIWSTDLADPQSDFFESEYFEEYGYADGWSEPTLGPDGTIYISFDDPYLRAVDPNGTIKWITCLGTTGGFTLTVDINGLIYAASDDGHLYVVDPDGNEVSRYHSDNWLSYPVITRNKTIIIADSRDNSFLIEQPNNVAVTLSPECSEEQLPDLWWIEDINSDGTVNFNDIALLTTGWLNDLGIVQ
ncbi:MAG: PQQ-like beta-propeller repeat protein [Sedimentisphaerales bacterium]|nr:PQQ-like beta-propeller repeat protein [Sedimentisphaerales bacterium]